jgi:hypothetical protein
MPLFSGVFLPWTSTTTPTIMVSPSSSAIGDVLLDVLNQSGGKNLYLEMACLLSNKLFGRQ